MFKTKLKPNLLRIPKILSILYISLLIFLTLDTFQENIPLFDQITNFILQITPVLVFILFLYISWNNPKIGGLLFIVATLIITLFFHTYQVISSFLAVSFPLLAIGIMFIIFGIADNK